MRATLPRDLERGRIREGPFATDPADGPNGAFLVRGPGGMALRVIASDGEGWEHVSVSLDRRCPTWAEMALVKGLFWAPDEAVMQLHPPETDYINHHPYCLHLWRPADGAIPLPPPELVGPAAAPPAAAPPRPRRNRFRNPARAARP